MSIPLNMLSHLSCMLLPRGCSASQCLASRASVSIISCIISVVAFVFLWLVLVLVFVFVGRSRISII